MPDISDKYTFDKNTYFRDVKSDVNDKISVEVGDSKQEDFYPQFKVMRWDNEVNFSLRLVHEEINTAIATDNAKEEIEWRGSAVSAIFHEKNTDEYPEGAYAFDVILKEMPKSNVINFTINTKGLEFFYQPELTLDEILEGCERPENVVGSYAVYYKDCPANIQGGKLYKCGKFGHLYRPVIIDANENKCYGELNLYENLGILTVTIPQKFLDTAVFPVIIDPDFGYTTAGSGSYNINNNVTGSIFTLSEDGTVTEITASLSQGPEGGANVLTGIYTTAYNLVTNGGTGEISFTGMQAWKTFTFSSNPSLTEADYILTAHGEYIDFNGIYLYNDVGTTDQGLVEDVSYTGSAVSSLDEPMLNNYKFSIYATYTASASGWANKIRGYAPAAVAKIRGYTLAEISKIRGV